MIAYCDALLAGGGPDLGAWTDLYIAWRGQGPGYKLAWLKFSKLRAQAKKMLGDTVDIRVFHDQLLSGGAMSLDLLDERANAWIAAQKTRCLPVHRSLPDRT